MRNLFLGVLFISVLLAGCTTYVPGELNATNGTSIKGGTNESALALDVYNHPQFGNILVDQKGMTLYTFKNDNSDSSTCYDACAKAWPPVLVQGGAAPTVGSGVTGTIGMSARTDGTQQVTYDGSPLYYFIKDKNPGDALGNNVNGFGNLWLVVPINSTGGA